MTEPLENARQAFERHTAYSTEDGEYILGTTAFDSRVVASESDADSWMLRYRLTVRTPTLASAVEEDVGPSLREGWFETFKRRLEDAPGAVREDITLDDFSARSDDGEAIAEFAFQFGNSDRAPDVAKAIAEYVEGTYVEGIVPGYTYRPPVSELLSNAHQGNNDEVSGGPTPL